MGAFGKLAGVYGCDLVTGTDPFIVPTGKHIWMFKSNEDDTEIAEFDLITVDITNDAWGHGANEDAETVDDATFVGEALAAGMEVYFDGPVTSITLGAGSGMVYYISAGNQVVVE
jgi:hypothetical protein